MAIDCFKSFGANRVQVDTAVRVGQSYTRSLAAIGLESLCHLKRVCTSMLRATPPVCMALIFVFVGNTCDICACVQCMQHNPCMPSVHRPPLLLLSPPLTRAPRTAHDSILVISRALSFSAQVQRAVQQACIGNTTGQHVQVFGRVWVVGLDVIGSLETLKLSVGHAHSHNAHTRGQLTRTASTAASGKNAFVFHANWQQLHGIGRAARQWGLVADRVHPLPRSPFTFTFFTTHTWHHALLAAENTAVGVRGGRRSPAIPCNRAHGKLGAHPGSTSCPRIRRGEVGCAICSVVTWQVFGGRQKDKKSVFRKVAEAKVTIDQDL
jgi:hypothetical protein